MTIDEKAVAKARDAYRDYMRSADPKWPALHLLHEAAIHRALEAALPFLTPASEQQAVEKHPGPFVGADAELARACAMAVIERYGSDDPQEMERIRTNGIWNDHVAVQSALAAIHHFRKQAAMLPASEHGGMGERDTKDFAIEFGEYLAKSVEQLLGFQSANGAPLSRGDMQTMTELTEGVRSSIYEFRKRAAKVALPPQSAAGPEKAGWEVEGFIDRLTRRDDSNSERLVLEAIRHLRGFSRDCDALRESNARLTQERDHAIENEAREREEHDELRAEHLREIERLRAAPPLMGVERDAVIQAMKDHLRLRWVLVGGGDEDLEKVHVTDESLEQCADAICALPQRGAVTQQGREDVEQAREGVVLAIAFLRRDFGTDRFEKTLEQVLAELVKADAILLALKHTGQPQEEALATLKWISEQRWNENADLDDICTRADRALSAPASPRAEGEWQPIETAALTGECRLLACDQGVRTLGFWGKGVSEPEGSESWRDSCRWRPIKPTHWRPLPAPSVIAEKRTP
jgi:FtsZ-binding cell division protein ZapB